MTQPVFGNELSSLSLVIYRHDFARDITDNA